MAKSFRPLPALLLATLLAFQPVARQAKAESLAPGLVRAELLSGWRRADGRRMSALRLILAPGWKTYWRSPGEAGISPVFDWQGSENVGTVTLHWPRPQVFDLSGYRTLAYPGELVLPVEIAPLRAGDPVTLRLSADIGICEEICVPVTIRAEATLSDAGTADPAIKAALARLPADAQARGLPTARCLAEPIRDGLRLTTAIPFSATRSDAFAIVELDDRPVWSAPVETRLEGGGMVQVSDLVPADAKPFALSRASVRMTVFDGDDVVEFQGCKG